MRPTQQSPDKLVLPEQAVVLETDAAEARRIARQFLASYLALPNYANNWFRFGFPPTMPPTGQRSPGRRSGGVG